MPRIKIAVILLMLTMQNLSCHNNSKVKDNEGGYQLVILDPGHFHAALVQKSMYAEIDSTVKVFAPKGEELEAYLSLIKDYNSRKDNPTAWKEDVYTGDDFLQKMLKDAVPGKSIVVLAGNNKKKINYISSAVDAGLNVLADKPMAINTDGFAKLKQAFGTANEKKVLLYDIMTERYAVTNILQKMLLGQPDIFGTVDPGSDGHPSVIFKSTHNFYKEVSGKPLIRPDWYFDTEQQGDGIVDVTTHVIDLAMWEVFGGERLDYNKEIEISSAKRWPTEITLPQFSKVTGKDSFPEFLKKDLKDGILNVYANGEINYTIKGIHTQIEEEWHYEAPKGGGDTYHSEIKGTKATLLLLQDQETHFEPTLYVLPNKADETWQADFKKGIDKLNQSYPGLSFEKEGDRYKIVVPAQFATTHEGQFAEVVKKYLTYLNQGTIPGWEQDFMLAKYYLTTESLKISKK